MLNEEIIRSEDIKKQNSWGVPKRAKGNKLKNFFRCTWKGHKPGIRTAFKYYSDKLPGIFIIAWISNDEDHSWFDFFEEKNGVIKNISDKVINFADYDEYEEEIIKDSGIRKSKEKIKSAWNNHWENEDRYDNAFSIPELSSEDFREDIKKLFNNKIRYVQTYIKSSGTGVLPRNINLHIELEDSMSTAHTPSDPITSSVISFIKKGNSYVYEATGNYQNLLNFVNKKTTFKNDISNIFSKYMRKHFSNSLGNKDKRLTIQNYRPNLKLYEDVNYFPY